MLQLGLWAMWSHVAAASCSETPLRHSSHGTNLRRADLLTIRLALAPADRENLVAIVHQTGHKVGAHVPCATDNHDPQHLSVRSSSEDNRSENTVHLSEELEARYTF